MPEDSMSGMTNTISAAASAAVRGLSEGADGRRYPTPADGLMPKFKIKNLFNSKKKKRRKI